MSRFSGPYSGPSHNIRILSRPSRVFWSPSLHFDGIKFSSSQQRNFFDETTKKINCTLVFFMQKSLKQHPFLLNCFWANRGRLPAYFFRPPCRLHNEHFGRPLRVPCSGHKRWWLWIHKIAENEARKSCSCFFSGSLCNQTPTLENTYSALFLCDYSAKSNIFKSVRATVWNQLEKFENILLCTGVTEHKSECLFSKVGVWCGKIDTGK